MISKNLIKKFLDEHNELFKNFEKIHEVDRSSDILVESIKNGKKILVCGNGGSAADSQHFAAELIGRFEKDRDSLPAIALSTDTSILTAVGNDYGYDHIFARQVNALGAPGDVLIGISTSGNSPNVILAIKAAKAKKMTSIGLLGKGGGMLRSMVDFPVVVPHDVTARIQEVHIFILHLWAGFIEQELFS
jgi:D-sedoheptulose 7-phosphate isomerase